MKTQETQAMGISGRIAAAFQANALTPLLALVALLPVAAHLAWQVLTLAPDDGAGALARFRSNRFAGLLMFLACVVVGTPL